MASSCEQNIDAVIKLRDAMTTTLITENEKVEKGREEHSKEQQSVKKIERILKIKEDRLQSLRNGKWLL